MSLNDTMTNIANAIRNQYGTTDKYHLADMPTLIDNLEVKNLLEAGQTFDSTVDTSNSKVINGITLDVCNSLIGKSVTISFDVEWEGWKTNTCQNRVGMEWGFYAEDQTATWANAWVYPNAESGKQHVAATTYIQNKTITGISEGSFFNQINPDAKVKATNLKVVLNPMGGDSTSSY